ncbi:hypothetical protein LQV63_04970 [Paenibacillus profundus]|uniref:Sugar ABC transporter permease n=1 Tax=Paenibacillus profundus TaxID=1173085 RepID=A0ABS8Y9W8_9BACL|nr:MULTISPECIES: hypothetical protein [Paenibacillus]MCE5168665.1 hypothetical protein [Paenibacillus profundus]
MRLQHKLRRDSVIALAFLAPSLFGFMLFYIIPLCNENGVLRAGWFAGKVFRQMGQLRGAAA